MKLARSVLVSLAAGALAAAGAVAQEAQKATADFTNSEGDKAGVATLTETPNGVLIEFMLDNVPEGEHGFHIHQTGQCDGPDFQSAGGHYSPRGNSHGYKQGDGFHAGDMPNQVVAEDGRIRAFVFNDQITLGDGEGTLFDDDGSAIVLHAGADDYESQPSGDAGSRLLCAVIEQS